MQLRLVPVGQIQPASYNPRLDLRPGDPAYERLKKSLGEFGCAHAVPPKVAQRYAVADEGVAR